MKRYLPTSLIDTRRLALWLALLCLMIGGEQARAQDESSAVELPQTRDDAWWTGPMLANSAETLPPGHILLEPYLYDIASRGVDSFGSRTYMNYGVANDFTMGIIPVFGYNRVSGAPNSSGVQVGDITVQAQYRLRQFHEGSWLPTVAILLQETFSSGAYDRLGHRSADGLGSGVYTTTLALNTQTYVWMPNGRIVRMRFNVSYAWSSSAHVEGVSVYGTDAGFRGSARPGDNVFANAAIEYSMTRRWVLALDLIYGHNSSTRVSGQEFANGDPFPPAAPLGARSNRYIGFAPAVEYNWSPNIGLLLGVRVIPSGNRTTSSITPAIALNYVH